MANYLNILLLRRSCTVNLAVIWLRRSRVVTKKHHLLLINVPPQEQWNEYKYLFKNFRASSAVFISVSALWQPTTINRNGININWIYLRDYNILRSYHIYYVTCGICTNNFFLILVCCCNNNIICTCLASTLFLFILYNNTQDILYSFFIASFLYPITKTI